MVGPCSPGCIMWSAVSSNIGSLGAAENCRADMLWPCSSCLDEKFWVTYGPAHKGPWSKSRVRQAMEGKTGVLFLVPRKSER
ncbi:hypothetical protein BJX61DRAFT_497406 [Aspergillus egyptiacus]|nr:hypothetical protein BJX61DRAFT_497406 [Aspergillus egyptiacus]